MIERGRLGVFVCLSVFAFFASLAFATEITRTEYKEQVEPICKTNSEANEKILKGVRKEVKEGKLKPAARQFSLASAALKKAYRELSAVPKPPADTAKLTKWISYAKVEAELFQKAAKALGEGQRGRAESYVIKLEHTARLANNQVLSFEFRYCRFEPSKYT